MKNLLWVVALCVAAVAAQVPSGTISGQVLSRSGQPASGVRVSAMAVQETSGAGNGTALVSLGMTDDTGRYRLENIPPGRYYVVAGFVDSPTYYPGVSSATGATILNVLSGTPIPDINFTTAVSAGVTVSGRLVGDVTGVTRIRLIGGGAPATETTLNPDGSFQFVRVRPGNYQINVSGGVSAQQMPVVVGDNDVKGIEYPVVRTFTITGSVVVPNNGVRPRFTLAFMPLKGGGTAANATLLTSGSFGSVLVEGEYRLGWSSLPRGYEIKSITAGSTDLLTSNLTVSRTTASVPIVVTLGVDEKPPWVKFSGRVNGLAALPTAKSFRISLSGQLVLDPLDVPVQPDGTFEFARVLPGSYTATFFPALPFPSTPVTVPNQDMTSFNINIPPMKEVRGVVSNHNGSSLTLRVNWSEPLASGFGSGNVAVSTSTAADGQFTLVLPEGQRRVTLNVPAHTVQSFTYGTVDLLKESLKISASDTDELHATVTPVGNVRIIATGVPPPPPPPPPPQRVIRIDPEVAKASLISSVAPVSPPLAVAARIQGVVILQIQITTGGEVTDITVLTGHPLLNEAAVQAVRQWRYQPQMVSGQPIAAITTVTVNFAP